jgi:hypothetical protein
MTTGPSIVRQLERQSVVPMESTIPDEMTCEQWRRLRSARRVPCDHMHESTSRYDPARKLLSFLLVCPTCRTEKVIHTQPYEPRYQPQLASGSPGAAVHQLPIPRHQLPQKADMTAVCRCR